MAARDADGERFGRYVLHGLIGKGGMGQVYRAYDTETDRTVALKVLPPKLAKDNQFQERFRREALAAAKLNSPHVIPIHGAGEIDGRLYVDMRLIEGTDVDGLLQSGPMTPARAVRIVSQVATALDAAHRVGLVHRDVKPSNVLVDASDFAYLIDFGIARVAGEGGLTSTGMMLGTWAYMAPERFTSGQADHRADVYALACVLFECVTGRRPFEGDGVEQQAAGHMFAEPPRASSYVAGVPAGLDEVIAAGMAKDPAHRYGSAGEFAQAAQAALRGEPTAPPSPYVTHAPPTRHGTPMPPARYTQVQPAPPTVAPSPLVASRSRRTPVMIGGAVAVVVAVVAAIAIIAWPSDTSGNTVPNQAGPSTSAPNQDGAPAAPSAEALPFTGLNQPAGIAVDGAGNVYVSDGGNRRVLKLAPDGSTPEVLPIPFADPAKPGSLAVDAAGTVYVMDAYFGKVMKWTPGSSPMELPFTGLKVPEGVAVDGAGDVYVADTYNNRVVKLATATGVQTDVPFEGIEFPEGIAADTAGNVYFADKRHNQVLEVAAGATTQTVIPLTGVFGPSSVAANATGDVYVTNDNRGQVVKVAAGSRTQTTLGFPRLDGPKAVAVDSKDNVYVLVDMKDPVLKLPAS
jgi:serine/threonine-protein kinase